MTENQKKPHTRQSVRVVLLAAALAAALCVTAFATDGPVKEAIEGFFLTFTYTYTAEDGDTSLVLGDYDLSAEGISVGVGRILPTMSFEQKDGRSILTLDGEERDVTEVMEKDGCYETELEGVHLRVEPDGFATITVPGKDGEEGTTYTMDLVAGPGVEVVTE